MNFIQHPKTARYVDYSVIPFLFNFDLLHIYLNMYLLFTLSYDIIRWIKNVKNQQ